MVTFPSVTEGFVPFRGYRTWYRIVGEQTTPGKLPLLLVHGGPGIPSDCLEPLEAVAATGRQVIFYDQLGCGYSDIPDNPEFYSLDLFVEEIATVRATLGLTRCHLLGFSWGGAVAIEYILTQLIGIASLILLSAFASQPAIAAAQQEVYDELPTEVAAAMRRHEAAGEFDHPDYQALRQRHFDLQYVCRIDPWPAFLQRALARANFAVADALDGSESRHAPGGISTWDITAKLGDITLPTLILSGRHDGLVRGQDAVLAAGIPGAEWVRFEDSSHYAHAEEPERFISVLDDFLTRVEGAQDRYGR